MIASALRALAQLLLLWVQAVLSVITTRSRQHAGELLLSVAPSRSAVAVC
jgi:hypothetical protein